MSFDELTVHLVAVLLGGGVRPPDGPQTDLRCTSVTDAPGDTRTTCTTGR